MFTATATTVVLRKGGVYRDGYLARCKGRNEVFVRYGSGYVRLMSHSETSVKGLHWDPSDFNDGAAFDFTVGGQPLWRKQ